MASWRRHRTQAPIPVTSRNTPEAQDFPRESWAFLVRRLENDAYLIYLSGEVSLVTEVRLRYLIGTLLKENDP